MPSSGITLHNVIAGSIRVSAFGSSEGLFRIVLALAAVTAAEQAVVTNTIGLLRLPRPAEQFVSQNSLPILSMVVVAAALVLAAALRSQLTVLRGRSGRGGPPPGVGPVSRLVLGLAALSSVSTLTAVSLIVLIAVHSPLLPNTAIPSPAGPHDQNLEMELTAVQASDFLIPGDPSQYAPGPSPPGTRIVVAEPVRSAGPPAVPGPYRVVVSIHDLATSGPGMFIESVALHVVRVDTPPQTIRVWHDPPRLDYAVNPFAARYSGERAGSTIIARYAGPVPDGHVQLRPRETDELTINVSSSIVSAIEFSLEVSYRLADQMTVHVFTMPTSFRSTFVEGAYWLRYTMQDGRLVPS